MCVWYVLQEPNRPVFELESGFLFPKVSPRSFTGTLSECLLRQTVSLYSLALSIILLCSEIHSKGDADSFPSYWSFSRQCFSPMLDRCHHHRPHTPSKSCSLDWLDMRPSVRINHISTSGPQMVSVRRYSMCYTVTVGRFRAILRPNQTETLALCSPTCFRIDWVTVQQLLAVIRVELHSLIATKTL